MRSQSLAERTCAAILLATAGLFLIQYTWHPPFAVGFALSAAASLIVLWLNLDALDLKTNFQEALRIPGVRWFLRLQE